MKNSTSKTESQSASGTALKVLGILLICHPLCTAQTSNNGSAVKDEGIKAVGSKGVNSSGRSNYNDSLKQILDEKIETIKILNDNAKKVERKGKYYRRTRVGRIRSFTYDFARGKFICDPDPQNVLYYDPTNCNPPYEIHEMDAVRIKIININPFIYTVNLYELQGDRISNENLTEGNLSRSLTINLQPLAPLSVEKLGLASTTNASLMTRIQDAERLEREIGILKARRHEQELLVSNDSVDSTRQANTMSLKVITDSINKMDSELFALRQETDRDSLSVDKIRGKEIELQACLGQLQDNAFAINSFVDAYNSFAYLIHSPTNSAETIREYMDATFPSKGPTLMAEYTKRSSEVLRKIGEANLKVQELIELDAQLIKSMTKQKKDAYETRVVIYNVIQQKLDVFEKDFKALDGNKLIGQIMFLRTMVDPANFTIIYETHSIAENADYIKYSFEFKPTSSNNTFAPASRADLELAFQIHEGAKFDISSGFVLDFGLTDPSFYFDKTADASGAKVYVRKGKDLGNVNPSIAVFLNGYKRTSTNFKLGGALGVGLSNTARFRLYAGPSVIIGRKERVVVSGGVSIGAISRLADGYKEDMELDNNASLPNEVPTVLDHYKPGAYIGIGFNLTGKENKSFMEKLKFN